MRVPGLILLTVLCAATLVACGPRRGSESKEGELNVALFKGGYGTDFFEEAAKEYEAAHPGKKIKVWGNPRVWEQLRPLFVAGTPPDLTWPGWGMDYWPLVYEKKVIPLDTYLDGAPYEGRGAWRDTFEPSLLALGQHEGKQYMLPYFFSINGWWYDKALFAKHGWTPPKTWSAMLALCGKIKAAGIAPITYQGKYPYYAIAGFLVPWAISHGGMQVFDDCQNLKPGAWKSPSMLEAARRIKQLMDLGYFQKGANGMSHTEAQMEFVTGRAAMIPCGTWLHSEMREQLPKDGFEMTFFLPPALDDGKGDPTAVAIGIEPWVIPTDGKNRALAVDFYKYLTTPEKARQFVEQKGTLMSVKGSDQATMPPYLEAPAAVFRAAKVTYSSEYAQWYPALGKASQDAMSALMTGESTPEQFVQRLEDAAEQARRDPNLVKHRVVR
ncbi:MAG: extracellular solute-binding protein [Chthonomonadales bacterium]|nr:extracellular solute-binding protein [Chthonomonadales bacterium]